MAKLTTKKRKKLKKGSFAIPSQRKYPIDTISRARNALARVAQHGTAAEKKTVRNKVHKKYLSIKISGMTRKKKGKKK